MISRQWSTCWRSDLWMDRRTLLYLNTVSHIHVITCKTVNLFTSEVLFVRFFNTKRIDVMFFDWDSRSNGRLRNTKHTWRLSLWHLARPHGFKGILQVLGIVKSSLPTRCRLNWKRNKNLLNCSIRAVFDIFILLRLVTKF